MLKHNWNESRDRFAAFWNGAALDRDLFLDMDRRRDRADGIKNNLAFCSNVLYIGHVFNNEYLWLLTTDYTARAS